MRHRPHAIQNSAGIERHSAIDVTHRPHFHQLTTFSITHDVFAIFSLIVSTSIDIISHHLHALDPRSTI